MTKNTPGQSSLCSGVSLRCKKDVIWKYKPKDQRILNQKSRRKRYEACGDMSLRYKKDTRHQRGQKSFKYRKPAVRDLLTAGVGLSDKKDIRHKRGHKTPGCSRQSASAT
ncbi:MAG TPA: hypothetical protein IAB39_05125 [Candidatus Onthovicinus excrementipullorum]|nr:hypothetical protein [Candidatus Onthovicinus excrementipullorum]